MVWPTQQSGNEVMIDSISTDNKDNKVTVKYF